MSAKVDGLVQGVKIARERLDDRIDVALDLTLQLGGGEIPRLEQFATVKIEVE